MATMRAYKPGDSEALTKAYREAARVLVRQTYSEEATRVWALYPEDMEEFHATLAEGLTRPLFERFGYHYGGETLLSPS